MVRSRSLCGRCRRVGVHVFSIFAGIKESVCWTPPPEVNPNKTCEYQALCSRFKDLLTLPGVPPNVPQKPSQINVNAALLSSPLQTATSTRT